MPYGAASPLQQLANTTRSGTAAPHAASFCCSAQSRSAGEASTSGRGDLEDGGDGKQQSHSPNKKQRLDDYCLSLHPEYSKNLIQSWIVQGKVLINDR
jgi:hypothetical protein